MNKKDKRRLNYLRKKKYLTETEEEEFCELSEQLAYEKRINAPDWVNWDEGLERETGTSPAEPLPTITAQSSAGGYAECRAVLAKVELGNWPQIRQLLNKHCGYDLKDDEVILLIIRGIAYYIRDISLRMLTPRELYSAMSFPADYIIERDYLGNEYPKSKQVARCGNAVCCVLAEAMVRANFPEWCQRKITTMEQFRDAVAV